MVTAKQRLTAATRVIRRMAYMSSPDFGPIGSGPCAVRGHRTHAGEDELNGPMKLAGQDTGKPRRNQAVERGSAGSTSTSNMGTYSLRTVAEYARETRSER